MVFDTLVGVFVFSVMWSELLITSAISCPLWSSVCECHKVECAFTSPVRTECGLFVMCCMFVAIRSKSRLVKSHIKQTNKHLNFKTKLLDIYTCDISETLPSDAVSNASDGYER